MTQTSLEELKHIYEVAGKSYYSSFYEYVIAVRKIEERIADKKVTAEELKEQTEKMLDYFNNLDLDKFYGESG